MTITWFLVLFLSPVVYPSSCSFCEFGEAGAAGMQPTVHNSFLMWPHLQPHKFMTAAVLIAKPKYNWVMRNKFIVHWPCLRITALDVRVLQIINKVEHAHTSLWAKNSSLWSVWSEGAGTGWETEYLQYATVFGKVIKRGHWVCLLLAGVRQQV